MPADDLALFDGMTGGQTVAQIADDLGCDAATVKSRWRAVCGLGANGLTTDQRALLGHALQFRAREAGDA